MALHDAENKERHLARNSTPSEALPVNDGWARLVILALGDPHLLEGAQRGEDGATDPNRVLALWWGHHFDLHCGRCQGGELLGHALADAGKHRGATRKDDIAVEVLTDVNVALHDGLEGGVVDTA